MKMTRPPEQQFLYKGTLLALVSWLALSMGCVRPPQLVLQDARTSIRRAREAQAESYAPQAYQAAEHTFSEGLAEIEAQKQKTVFSRSYGKAAVLFMKAKKLGDEATSRAEEHRKEVKAEVRTLVENAHQALKVAREAVEVTGNEAQSQSALRSRVTSLSALLSQAENDLAEGKYLAAHDEAEDASAQANGIIDDATGAHHG